MVALLSCAPATEHALGIAVARFRRAVQEREQAIGEIRAYLGSPQSQKVTFGNSC